VKIYPAVVVAVVVAISITIAITTSHIQLIEILYLIFN